MLLTVISVGVNVWTTKIHLLFRFGYYYDVYYILFVPKYLKKIKSAYFKIAFSILFFVLGVGFFIFKLIANDARCVPYKFFWQSYQLFWA
jgi:hypothetical protein